MIPLLKLYANSGCSGNVAHPGVSKLREFILEDIITLVHKFFSPLSRLLLGLACGLLIANILEAMRWTNHLARIAFPLARLAHLSSTAASAFALAFISPAAANSLLSENHGNGAISTSELMLANLFNGLPACLSHAPTIFLLTWPVLGPGAMTYVGITLLAAILRTAITILLGRFLLDVPVYEAERVLPVSEEPFVERLRKAMIKAWKRFCIRMPKLALFTIPIYILMYVGQVYGIFQIIESWLAANLHWMTFLKPQAMGIIVMQLVAEMGATLGAASAALADGSLTQSEIVTAILVGNVLATPLRAMRHQLPAYAGFYRARLAFRLVVANQTFRAASMIVMIAIYLLV